MKNNNIKDKDFFLMASPQQQTTTLQQTIKSGLNGKINGKNWKVSYDDVAAIVDKALVEGSVTLNLDEFSPTNFLSREFDNGPLENDEIRIVHGAVVRLPFLPNTKGWKHVTNNNIITLFFSKILFHVLVCYTFLPSPLLSFFLSFFRMERVEAKKGHRQTG